MDEDFHKRSEVVKIPEFTPSYQEISKQMRINVDILKQEITDHIDKELKRFKQEMING